MALPRLATSPSLHTLAGAHSFMLGKVAWHSRPVLARSLPRPSLRPISSTPRQYEEGQQQQQKAPEPQPSPSQPESDPGNFSIPADWEDNPQYSNVTQFSELPHRFFGYNQHIKINEDFKESLRQILWQFRAPIRYAFAYGSGVFGQTGSASKTSAGLPTSQSLSPHPDPPKAVEEWQKGGAKVIDFIFGVSHTQHWHSLNLTQHPDHYSALRHLPYSSAAISWIQDRLGAGVYFNPYITVNGVMIKYGVVNLETLATDLNAWSTLYLAGRLQKPVKILRDHPGIRMANQMNLLSALRTALLMLPEHFTERQLYEKIAGLSYMGDPRMLYIPGLGASENMSKVTNIVGAQLPGFRQLYVPLIEQLPNVDFTDSRKPVESAWEKEDAIRHTGSNVELSADVLGGKEGLLLTQDLDPRKRGNMVRRLPSAFRKKLYYQYKSKFQIPGSAFDPILEASEDEDAAGGMRKREGGDFERRIAAEADLHAVVGKCVQGTVAWPATSQTVKSFFTAGAGRAWRYYADKRKRNSEGAKKKKTLDGEEVARPEDIRRGLEGNKGGDGEAKEAAKEVKKER